MSRILSSAAAIAVGAMLATAAHAADWKPEKPVELIVPYKAGGGTDTVARAVVEVINNNDLSPQPWVVVNKPGGGGMTGLKFMVDRPDDQHTITMMTSSGMTSAMLQSGLGLSWKQLTPIANLILDVQYLVTHKDSGFKSIDEVLKYAKDNPGQLKVGGAAIGNEDHLSTLMMMQEADLKVRYIPFQGGGEVKQNIAGGQIDVAWLNPSEMRGFLLEDGGTVFPIAVAWTERTADFPDVPTFKEKGHNVVFDSFFRGVLGGGELSDEARDFYAGVIKNATQSDAWAKALEKKGLPGQYIGAADYQSALEAWDAKLSALMPLVEEVR